MLRKVLASRKQRLLLRTQLRPNPGPCFPHIYHSPHLHLSVQRQKLFGGGRTQLNFRIFCYLSFHLLPLPCVVSLLCLPASPHVSPGTMTSRVTFRLIPTLELAVLGISALQNFLFSLLILMCRELERDFPEFRPSKIENSHSGETDGCITAKPYGSLKSLS